jgi:uncharacterized protein
MMSTTAHKSEDTFSKEERGPIRTCVGCRTRAPKDELVRLALPSLGLAPDMLGGLPEIAVDLSGKLPGRGVHLHPSRACATAAIKRGGLAQALKRAPKTTVAELIGALAARHQDRGVALLGTARRAGRLAIGPEAVREAMKEGRLQLLLVASDAEGAGEALIADGDDDHQHTLVLGDVQTGATGAERGRMTSPESSGAHEPRFGTKGALGRMFGRDEVAVLGVLDRGMADHVAHAMSVASELTASQSTEAP